MIYLKDLEEAKANTENIKKALTKIKKDKDKKKDSFFYTQHEKIFKKIDCLQCANCCKTTSPIFRDIDIKRISKKLRISEKNFIDEYLYLDKDQDYVLKSSPCFFLDTDNTCRIYQDRPLACKEYPHTDRKNMYQIMDLTYNNSLICPAVANIVNQLISVNFK